MSTPPFVSVGLAGHGEGLKRSVREEEGNGEEIGGVRGRK